MVESWNDSAHLQNMKLFFLLIVDEFNFIAGVPVNFIKAVFHFFLNSEFYVPGLLT